MKILVPVGCRSDEGLSKPIIKRLINDDFFEVRTYHIEKPGTFELPYSDINYLLNNKKMDLVFITGDRIEMTAAACCAFHNNTPIAHYLAGVQNFPLTTLDDINRHCITLWSDIQFVESKVCMLNVEMLMQSIKKKANIYIVGITHLEDLEIDESILPNEEYDLFLLNPSLDTAESKWEYSPNKRIIIGSNPDPHPIEWKIISSDIYYGNLPRPQFLGLLKNCERFITNSSAAYYEAPAFLRSEQIIMIGARNKNRTPVLFTNNKGPPASELIITHLKKWWNNKNET